ncbi:MAG: hypothetical protein GXO69_08410 [Acidobacteria bacterium]|nr:hypothetical protein [Acidobacteriota bacterium]
MKRKKLIPIGRELRFIAFVTVAVLLSSLAGIGVIAIVFNRELGSGFAESFYTIRSLYRNLNAISTLAILLQLAVSVAILYLAALHYSHKISGPMYRFRTILNSYLEGHPANRIAFRSDDFLKPLAEMLQSVISREQKRKKQEETILELLEKDPPAAGEDREKFILKLRKHADEMEADDA